jgi:low affinity Fe/Cu permease
MTPPEVLQRRGRVSHRLAGTRQRRWRKGRPDDQTARPSASAIRPHRRWSSRELHRLGAVASHAWAGVVVAAIALGWIVYGSATGFPSYWQEILESAASVVTVIMLFAIQHIQARDQIVTQRKLDELLRAIPQADNHLIAVEEAPDEKLEAFTELNRQDRIDNA